MKKVFFIMVLMLLIVISAFAYNYGVPRNMLTLPDWALFQVLEAFVFFDDWIVMPDNSIWGNLRYISMFETYIFTHGVSMGWLYPADMDPYSSDYDTIRLYAYDGRNYRHWTVFR